MNSLNLNTIKSEDIGLSQKGFLTLFLLHELKKSSNYPLSLHKTLQERFSGKVHSYDYMCKIAKELTKCGHLKLSHQARRNIYSITPKGLEYYTWYQVSYKDRLQDVKDVIDRFTYDLTGSGITPPVVYELPEEHRMYFSKIISVMDLVRYITLKTAAKRGKVYMGEIGELLKVEFGWIASNGYLYDLVSDMEENRLLIGKWESEKRTKRYLKITDEGKYHYKQIADAAAFRVQEVQKYLHTVLKLL